MSKSVRGLLVKDMKLLMSQYKMFFAVLIFWGIFVAGSWNFSFFVVYSGMMCAFVILGTLSYDELDNGMAFLFTLPVTRRDYVREKFLFGFVLIFLAVAAATLISALSLAVMGKEVHPTEFFLTIAAVFPVAYLMLALEIPLQLKFGQGKGRVMTLVFVGFMAAAGGIFAKLQEMGVFDLKKEAGRIAGLGTGVLVAVALAALVLALLLSYRISCGVLEKKEY